MDYVGNKLDSNNVILRVKDVDWNRKLYKRWWKKAPVILRVKDVDWNAKNISFWSVVSCHPSCEGCGLKCSLSEMTALSARSSFVWRMWIEILQAVTGSYDNLSSFVWRMWIEMLISQPPRCPKLVILRVKDVDWNIGCKCAYHAHNRHPSCEGCGLKWKAVPTKR